jgi:hypothetical protein
MKRGRHFSPFALPALLVSALLINGASAMTEGYILAAAWSDNYTYLFDMSGTIVRTWDHSKLANPMNGYSCYLLPSGNLLRTAQVSMMSRMPPNAAPTQGAINEIDTSGNIVWTYALSNDTFHLHHDIKYLPNGHILATCFHWYNKTQVKNAGIDTSLTKGTMGTPGLLGERIIEIDPKAPAGKEIVWEWRIIDHVVPKEQATGHPEKISGSIVSALWKGQWVHLNGLDYDSTTDLIVFSSRIFSECYVIDHGTSTMEAKGSTGGKRGKGGDILYRWGKPGNYGASGATTINVLHSPTWVPTVAGKPANILFFHNNEGDSINGSQVIEIAPPLDASGNFAAPPSGAAFGPIEPSWRYTATDRFFSPFMSSALRLPSGNTLAEEAYPDKDKSDTSCSRVREIRPDMTVVSKFYLRKPRSGAFNPAKIMFYPSSHSGIKTLLPIISPTLHGKGKGLRESPFSIIFHEGRIHFSGVAGCRIEMNTLLGKKVFSTNSIDNLLAVNGLSPGSYIVTVKSKGRIRQMTAVLQ